MQHCASENHTNAYLGMRIALNSATQCVLVTLIYFWCSFIDCLHMAKLTTIPKKVVHLFFSPYKAEKLQLNTN